jgi:hypothetical protein
MIKLETFFRNHFDSDIISDDRMDLFAQDHIARLKANNPGDIYSTLVTSTEKAYNDYYTAKTSESFTNAQKEAATVDVDRYAKEFNGLVSMKEGIIRGTWGKASAQYQEFYPQGINEYNIATRANLNDLMDRYLQTATKYVADLPANFVEAFATVINNYKTSRTRQLGKMGNVTGHKDATAKNRDVLETQLMYNLLFIAKENIGDTAATKIYFTQHLIERAGKAGNDETGPDKPLTGTVPAYASQEIMHGGFDANTEFSFANTGTVALSFYTANLPTDPVPGTTLEVPPGEQATAFASELGSEENLFLMVHNANDTTDGGFEVVVEG